MDMNYSYRKSSVSLTLVDLPIYCLRSRSIFRHQSVFGSDAFFYPISTLVFRTKWDSPLKNFTYDNWNILDTEEASVDLKLSI